jgi:hypothetical protein
MKGRKLNEAMKKQTNIQTYKQTNSQTTIRYAPHPSFFCFVSLKYSKRNWVGGKKGFLERRYEHTNRPAGVGK